MAQLTQEMKDLIATQQCFIATVNPDGTPNVGPKRSTRVLDDEHLLFNEVTAGQTWANVAVGSRIAVAVVDRERTTGFRFAGTAEALTSGDLYEDAVATMRQRGMNVPLRAVVRVRIEKIYNLGFPGAGQQIG